MEQTTARLINRETATEWSGWFAALGDPTRVLILHLLSTEQRPLRTGEITERLDVGQSTISHHLAKLADVGFVFADRIGTSTLWRVNSACLASFPSAAEVIMGRIDPAFIDAMEGPCQ